MAELSPTSSNVSDVSASASHTGPIKPSEVSSTTNSYVNHLKQEDVDDGAALTLGREVKSSREGPATRVGRGGSMTFEKIIKKTYSYKDPGECTRPFWGLRLM